MMVTKIIVEYTFVYVQGEVALFTKEEDKLFLITFDGESPTEVEVDSAYEEAILDVAIGQCDSVVVNGLTIETVAACAYAWAERNKERKKEHDQVKEMLFDALLRELLNL